MLTSVAVNDNADNEGGTTTTTPGSSTTKPVAVTSSSTRSNKRLRFSDPDLKVIIKWTQEEEKLKQENDNGDDDDDADEDDDPPNEHHTQHAHTYHMYTQNLAQWSRFVDTALSVEMSERETRTIVFHGVSRTTFELALTLLRDSRAARAATLDDVLQVVPFYDQYEFASGLTLCDAVLAEYVGRQVKLIHNRNPPEDLNLLVRVIRLADQYHLPEATNKGVACLNRYFFARHNNRTNNPNNQMLLSLFSPGVFTEDHITKLQPLFQKGLLLLPPSVKATGDQELGSPLFPKYFCSCLHQQRLGTPRAMVLKNTKCGADGRYTCNSSSDGHSSSSTNWTTCHSGQYGYLFCIAKVSPALEERIHQGDCDFGDIDDFFDNDDMDTASSIGSGSDGGGDWSILALNIMRDAPHFPPTRLLWKSPYSSHHLFPPKEPWILVDKRFGIAKTAMPLICYEEFE